jgi:hypothetical protein
MKLVGDTIRLLAFVTLTVTISSHMRRRNFGTVIEFMPAYADYKSGVATRRYQ